jgi:hypothetical protein
VARGESPSSAEPLSTAKDSSARVSMDDIVEPVVGSDCKITEIIRAAWKSITLENDGI